VAGIPAALAFSQRLEAILLLGLDDALSNDQSKMLTDRDIRVQSTSLLIWSAFIFIRRLN
jgi:hypothetical protein